jgi:hypothetical protein
MIYSFECTKCRKTVQLTLPVSECDSKPPCEKCRQPMRRNFGADWATLQVNTQSCKDHDEVPANKRTVANLGKGMTPKRARALERRYAEDVQSKRELAEVAGGNRGLQRMEMSVPTELYHSKIRQTGDRSYWKDPKNRARHKAWKVTK